MYSTDNGPHQNSWPDAATTPFRSEKNTNWEGAFRVPAMIRWPGHIEPGTVKTGMFSGLDWFPTLLAAAGDTDIKDRLLEGTTIDGKEYKVHLDGYNQLPYLTGESDETARKEFFYFNDDGAIVGLRYENWKFAFLEQRETGTLQIWAEPFTALRLPKIFDLRSDPYERADITSNTYWDWVLDHAFLLVPAQAEVAKFFATFEDYPPSQTPASFSVDQIQKQLEETLSGMQH
jgi:arylsulfatase